MYPHDTILSVYDVLYEKYVIKDVLQDDSEVYIVNSILSDILSMYHEAREEFDADMNNMYIDWLKDNYDESER